MQDFWGDVKTVNGYCADHYFVIDELAARLTAERTSAAVHVVGSIKHGRFSEFEYSKKRADFRKEFNLGASEPAIGYFGQDLSRIEGYQLVLSDIALAIEAIGGARLIYRPHPLEDNASITLSLDIFKKRNIKLILAPNKSLDDVLAGVDVALSCFSTVGLDAAYLVRSKGAGPAIVYANYPEDIRSYWQRGSGLSNVPLVDEGCALSARNRTDLILALKEALRPGKARVLFERIQKQLPRQETAIDKAVSVIFNVLQK